MQNERGIVVLIPAYNEAASIRHTLASVMVQTRRADKVIVIANGCTDNTAAIAREYPVTVMELPRLEHRKSEALNRAWLEHGRDADIVISHDADTILQPTAFADWEAEFSGENFGGSTSKFTVQQPGLLGRIQKAEYAANIQAGLNRGWTSVLAGAGTAFSGAVLREVASREDREGPWSYESAVEDYELTYRIRELGYKTVVSPSVRAYTDGMRDLKSLWGQRLKWQAGTLHDLLRFGLNKLTLQMWVAQVFVAVGTLARILLALIIGLAVTLDSFTITWWLVALPLMLGVALGVKTALRIPHRDWKDLALATLILPMEFFQIVQGGWVMASWGDVIRRKVTKTKRDLWAAQYIAEGVTSVRSRSRHVGRRRIFGRNGVGHGIVDLGSGGPAVRGIGNGGLAPQER